MYVIWMSYCFDCFPIFVFPIFSWLSPLVACMWSINFLKVHPHTHTHMFLVLGPFVCVWMLLCSCDRQVCGCVKMFWSILTTNCHIIFKTKKKNGFVILFCYWHLKQTNDTGSVVAFQFECGCVCVFLLSHALSFVNWAVIFVWMKQIDFFSIAIVKMSIT